VLSELDLFQKTLATKLKNSATSRGYKLTKDNAATQTLTAPQAPKLSGEDAAALQWANSNPKDPRAAEIKKRLGAQ
jgi:hypothetical protein